MVHVEYGKVDISKLMGEESFKKLAENKNR
jgi:hypothetical protein